MTSQGGANAVGGGGGTVFKLVPDGTYTVIWSFNCADITDGCTPMSTSGLIQLSDGFLYGTTREGGASRSLTAPNGGGTVFKLLPDGTNFAVIKSFDCQNVADGCFPVALIEGVDGYLYGTSGFGGENRGNSNLGEGTVFKLLPNGMNFSLIKSFKCLDSTNGCNVQAGVIQASDTFLYGTTTLGGANGAFGNTANDGTVFRLATNGTGFTILKSFDCALDGPGCQPYADLIQASDGFLYGTTTSGGSFGVGTVFRLFPDSSGSQFEVLHSFDFFNDGSGPVAGVRQASDGFLYGSAFSGGSIGGSGAGTLFRVSTNGNSFSLLHTFLEEPDDGVNPNTRLALVNDGYLYGTTSQGGSQLLGTIFRLPGPVVVPQVPLIVTGAPASATFGTSFNVATTGGSGTGAVTFEASGACSNADGGALIAMTSGTGICMITAAKAADADYAATTSSPVQVMAVKANQMIVFAALPNKTLGDPPITVGATGGASGNLVTFITTTPTVCTSAGADGSTITLAATGSCTVRASQAGNANYNPAVDVDHGFLIEGGTLTTLPDSSIRGLPPDQELTTV